MSETNGKQGDDLSWPGAGTNDAVPAWAAPGQPAPPPPPPGAGSPAPGAAPSAPTPGGHAGGPPPPPGAAPTYRSWQPGIIPLRPLTFGDFLSVPFKAMRYNRAVVLGGPLMFTLIAAALAVTAMWLAFNDPQLGLMAANPPLSGINTETLVLIVVALVASLLADTLASAIVAPGVARAVLGERLSLSDAWKMVVPRFGHLILLYLFSAVAMTLVLAVGGVPFVLAVVAESVWGILASLLLLVVLTVPAAVLVSLIAGVTAPIIVLEKVGVITGIKRTMSLIRGRFWWSILILFVAGLMINVATTIVQYAGQFGALFVMLLVPDNIVVIMISFFVTYGIAMVISYVLLYSYLGSIFTLLYIDMRMRHEGFDLDLAQAAEARNAT